MKPLKLSFLLVLTVLILSGASESANLPLEPVPKENKSLPKEKQIRSDQKQENTKSSPISKFESPSAPVSDQKSKNDKEPAKQPIPSITDWIMVGVTTAYAIFAFLQWCAIRRQANIADKTASAIKHQATVANTTLAYTLRPKLIVRNVKIISDTGQDDWIIKPGEFYLEVVNQGGSATKIRSGKVAFYIDSISNPDFMKRPTDYSRWEDALSGEMLNPGFERFYKAAYEGVSVQDNLGTVLGFKRGILTVYGLGYFLYQDGIGNHYKTSFCRRYDRSIGRFISIDDPDHEYAD